MATEVTKVIDPNSGTGYDYASLYDWEAAQQGDLTGARDEIAVAKCRCTGGTADSTAVTIDGFTTSATQYIKIWTDTAESYRHNGTWQTGNKYRLQAVVDGSAVVIINDNYVKFVGLQICSDGTWSSRWCIASMECVGIEISESIFRMIGSDGTVGSLIFFKHSTTAYAYKIKNCLLYDGLSRGLNTTDGANLSVLAYNLTVANCASYGIESWADRIIAKNCRSYFTEGFRDLHGDSSNNVDSDTDSFVNSAADDFHLASNDTICIGQGVNLYNDATYPFQDDIDGQDRGGAAASWDIGADEYVSAVSIEQEGFRFRNDDGSESAATWKANQDVNITLAADTAFRLRFLLKATGNPDSIDAQVEARVKPSGGAFGAWEKIN